MKEETNYKNPESYNRKSQSGNSPIVIHKIA